MGEGKWAEAIDLLESRLDRVTDCFELTWNLGWCHLKLHRYDSAIEVLSRAVEIDSTHPISHWALGVAYMEAQRLDEACSALETSLSLKNSARTRQILGLVYRLQGRVSDAESLYSEGLKTLPRSPVSFETFGDFLSDTGEPENAVLYYSRAKQLREEQ